MENVRVARVKANGRRYIVEQVAFARKTGEEDRVHCFGEVTAVDRLRNGSIRTKHADRRTFLGSAVEVTEVPKTEALARELFQQHVDVRKGQGHVLEQRGRTVVDHGTQEQVAARREAREAFDRALEETGVAPVIRNALAQAHGRRLRRR